MDAGMTIPESQGLNSLRDLMTPNIMNIVVDLCICEFPREETQWVKIAITISLMRDTENCEIEGVGEQNYRF